MIHVMQRLRVIATQFWTYQNHLPEHLWQRALPFLEFIETIRVGGTVNEVFDENTGGIQNECMLHLSESSV
jgi:hypothetical protein